MIRIDLSKDEASRKPTSIAVQLLEFLNSFAQKGQKKKKAGKASLSSSEVILLAFSIAAAFLPNLISGEYQKFVTRQEEQQERELREKVETIKQDIQRLSAFQAELNSYEEQKKLVIGRLEAIRQLQGARGTPVNVLDAIGQSLPARVWLNSVAFSGSRNDLVVTLKGYAYANEEISDFVDKLGESVYLSEVGLDDVTATQIQDTTTEGRQFQVVVKPKGKFMVDGDGASTANAAAPGATAGGAPATGAIPGTPVATAPTGPPVVPAPAPARATAGGGER